jgi:hypothetical protein
MDVDGLAEENDVGSNLNMFIYAKILVTEGDQLVVGARFFYGNGLILEHGDN